MVRVKCECGCEYPWEDYFDCPECADKAYEEYLESIKPRVLKLIGQKHYFGRKRIKIVIKHE